MSNDNKKSALDILALVGGLFTAVATVAGALKEAGGQVRDFKDPDKKNQ